MTAKAPTKAQQERFDEMKDLGCIACILNGKAKPFEGRAFLPEIHHMHYGSKRRGHDETVPLCYWHHQGIGYGGITAKRLLEIMGPSWHNHRPAFRKRYGSDDEVIAIVNTYVGEKE